jgi:hypothetical protein
MEHHHDDLFLLDFAFHAKPSAASAGSTPIWGMSVFAPAFIKVHIADSELAARRVNRDQFCISGFG